MKETIVTFCVDPANGKYIAMLSNDCTRNGEGFSIPEAIVDLLTQLGRIGVIER